MIDEELTRYITKENIWSLLFDTVRLVNQEGEMVYQCKDGSCHLTNEPCYSVWGKGERCENCVSKQAYESNRQRVKIEYADHNYFLVIARPIVLKKKKFVVEFVLNMTHQLATGHDNNPDSFVMELIHQLESVSSHDAFSGLYNKKYLAEKVEARLADCKLNKRAFYVALWDIDNFKGVNDTFGHDFGDRVILHIAKVLRSQMKEIPGFVARFGGDEFVVVFDQQEQRICLSRLEAMKGQIDQQIYIAGNRRFHVTASCGLVNAQGAENFLSVMHAVDEKMYSAKRAGRLEKDMLK